jgi:hypothetical protein
MQKLFDAHIEIVKQYNNTIGKGYEERAILGAMLMGFRQAACLLLSEADYARMLYHADNYYLSQGIEVPMCCGVFLEPRQIKESEGVL